ncbi:leucine-rich repeat domain-containing protein [Saccharibacillus sacchari]|uniref:leucine-rich repeat domain-containing protein n=1 Tax=Saccharibacillus sacchari TaxID=456493 RepID=UPI0004B51093|nr:leucine-rich repeat domain-containing protein [Saccharibacillus sacchari]
MNIYNNPSGDAYGRLIDYAMAHCETFSFVDTRPPGGDEYEIPPLPLRIVEELDPYIIYETRVETGIGTEDRFYPFDQTTYVCLCCPQAAAIVKTYADNLLGWIGEGMPEDLCFQNPDGEDWLWTVTHEGYRELRVTQEEADELKETLRGVMLVERQSPLSAEELFELAKYHESDRFVYEKLGSDRVLARLHEIPSLRIIDLFDAHITDLPDSLFDLPHLEELKIWTGNLDGIPASIGKAQALKSLTIYNGCHPDPNGEPDWKAPSKEQLKLTKLPPEIGQLEQLRSLDLTYSGLTELPDELANLRRLEYLSLVNHRIEEKPTVLKKLNHAKNITFRKDGFF